MIDDASPGFMTARLALRTFDDGDEALYCELFGDVQTMQFIGAPRSRDRAAQSFATVLASTRRRPPERIALTAHDAAQQRAIGIVMLQHFDPARRSVELGIMLRPVAHAKGLGTEAVGGLVAWAFERLAIDEIWVRIAAGHLAAERIVGGLGFATVSGQDREHEGIVHRTWSLHGTRRTRP